MRHLDHGIALNLKLSRLPASTQYHSDLLGRPVVHTLGFDNRDYELIWDILDRIKRNL